MKIRRSFLLMLISVLITSIALHLLGDFSLAQPSGLEIGSCGNIGSSYSRAIDCVLTGRNFRRLRRFGDALAAYNQAIQYDANFAVAYYNRGIVQADQENWRAAIADFQVANRLNPKLIDVYQRWGNALSSLGNTDEANRVYHQRTTVIVDSGSARNHRQQGDTLRQSKQWDAAIEEYQTSIHLNPNLPATYNQLGITYYERSVALKQIEDLELSIEFYGTAIALFPNITEYRATTYRNLVTTYNFLGDLLSQQNRFEEARAAYTQPLCTESAEVGLD